MTQFSDFHTGWSIVFFIIKEKNMIKIELCKKKRCIACGLFLVFLFFSQRINNYYLTFSILTIFIILSNVFNFMEIKKESKKISLFDKYVRYLFLVVSAIVLYNLFLKTLHMQELGIR